MIENLNADYYDKTFKNGWGNSIPPDHLRYCLEKFILPAVSSGKEYNVLDFGCGNGVISDYIFQAIKNKGGNAKVCGCDVSGGALEAAAKDFPHIDFKKVSPVDDIKKMYGRSFDFIVSIQTLYFLGDDYLKRLTADFDSLIKPGGIVYFTMMGKKNYFYKGSERHKGKVRKVKKPDGRALYIRFVGSKWEIKKLFRPFKSLWTGYYDHERPKGSTYHYFFIGKKNA